MRLQLIRWVTGSLILVTSLIYITGCTATFVEGPPPPPARVVVPAPPPPPGHGWVPGHWEWDGKAWLWIQGHWQ